MSRPKNSIVEYRIYDLSEDFAVVCLDGEDWYISDVKSDRLHFHNCFEIGVCHNGNAIMSIEGTDVELGARSVVCVPQYVAHTTYSRKGERSLWSYLFVDFKSVLGGFGDANIKTPDSWHIFENCGDLSLYPLAVRVIDEIKARRAGWQSAVSSLLFVIRREIARYGDDAQETPNDLAHKKYVLAPALKYVSKHYGEKIYIDELAKICNLSVTHFRRLFLTVVGSSPLQFVNRQRVERACHLLLTTDMSVIEISETVGFFSLSSFSRCFRDVMRVSATDYRLSAATETGVPKGKTRSILPYRGWQRAEVPKS